MRPKWLKRHNVIASAANMDLKFGGHIPQIHRKVTDNVSIMFIETLT